MSNGFQGLGRQETFGVVKEDFDAFSDQIFLLVETRMVRSFGSIQALIVGFMSK